MWTCFAFVFKLSAAEINGACLIYPDGNMEVIWDTTCDKETFHGIQLLNKWDIEKAKKILEERSIKGDGLAKSALGLMIIRGYGYEANFEQGVKLIEEGAEVGWSDAYYYLAYIYGTSSERQNFDKAYDYAFRAYKEDKGRTLIRLAETYMKLYQDEQKEIKLFREALRCASAAGELGNPDGYDCAAHACFTIHPHAKKEAQQVLENLVPLSDAAKGLILEILFSEKRFSECERRAKEFLETYDYAFAKYTLALLYLQHINPEINTEKGLRLMREGAENGDSKSIWGMVCMCDNPRKYAPGNKKLKPDYEKALFWYHEAEKLDDELSQATAKAGIARYYYEGRGCACDISYAARKLRESTSLCETEEGLEFLSEVKAKSNEGSKDAIEFLKIYNDLK